MQNKQRSKEAIERGLQNVADCQTADGGFLYTSRGGNYTSESCAWAIMALTACGINPYTDTRFIENGNTVVDALMSFYDEKVGGFRHVNESTSDGYDATVNQMSTEQAYYALAQLYKTVPTKAALSKAAKAGSGKIKAQLEKGCGQYRLCDEKERQDSRGFRLSDRLRDRQKVQQKRQDA